MELPSWMTKPRPRTLIVIVNGFPRSGKDEFMKFAKDFIEDNTKNDIVGSISSISIVKSMLSDAGIDTRKKTSADRRLLSVVGDAVEEHSGLRSKSVITYVQALIYKSMQLAERPPVICFVDVREPKMIEYFKKVLSNEKNSVITLLVDRNKTSQSYYDNASDSNVLALEGGYDYVINNNHDLVAYRKTCVGFVKNTLLPLIYST